MKVHSCELAPAQWFCPVEVPCAQTAFPLRHSLHCISNHRGRPDLRPHLWPPVEDADLSCSFDLGASTNLLRCPSVKLSELNCTTAPTAAVQEMQSGESDRKVQEILPKSGLVVSEKGQLTEVRSQSHRFRAFRRPTASGDNVLHVSWCRYPWLFLAGCQSVSRSSFAIAHPFQVFCKPKILPLKSVTLQKLEEMEKRMLDIAKQQPSG